MLEPRLRTLAGRQLAWSPSTSKRGITAKLTKTPQINDKSEFDEWLKTIKGKFVLVSQNQITGRPDYQWEEYSTPESFEKLKEDRDKLSEKWFSNLRKTGYGYRDINKAFEDAGAVGVEMEVVPAQVATEISKRTKMLIIGMGAGLDCDVQYLFATDILGDNEGHVPRHSKVYRDFKSEYHRLHRESVAAFKEFRSDVLTGAYPTAKNDVSIDKKEFESFLKAIK